MTAVVATFEQEKARLGVFSVIAKLHKGSFPALLEEEEEEAACSLLLTVQVVT